MTTGRNALHEIDGAIADARVTLKRTSDAAAGDARAIANLERREVEIFQALADVRLGLLQSDEMGVGALGAVERKAETLMARHDEAASQMARDRDAAKNAIENFEDQRRKAEETHDSAVDRHDDAVTKSREKLEKSEAYQASATALEQANAVAVRAAQKLELARADLKEKGAPYESDPLFSYLRKRDFGSKNYKAFFLFAALDRWVAGLIKYRAHKLNYDRLLELPERLEEHAQRVDAASQDIERSLAMQERDALEKDGVGKLRAKTIAARAALETLDASITEAEDKHEALAQAYNDMAAGRDGPMHEARALLANTLQDKSIPSLQRLAAQTETLKDDRLVEDLIRARRERLEVEENTRAAAKQLRHRQRSLKDLEHVRRRFKGARFDSPYSEFKSRGLLSALLSEFLRGALTRDDLWRKLERSHKTRKRDWDDAFGGDDWRDAFGLPDDWGGAMDGSWGGSGGKSGGRSRRTRSPRMPRAPRRTRAPRIKIPRGRRGGFKTGGGF